MMLLRPQTPPPQPQAQLSQMHHFAPSSPPAGPGSAAGRKRKADHPPESNERLSKRLSLLNLEHNGQKLYVPVENAQRANVTTSYSPSTGIVTRPVVYQTPQPQSSPSQHQRPSSLDVAPMQLDDTKHKVYIYNIDDELSSESEPEADGGGEKKVIFLPDIERHLRANRIQSALLIGAGGGEPEDMAAKQMVLYRVPRSISVPEEQDSVRKAIIEARARARERQGMGESERPQGPISVVGATFGGEVPMEDEEGDDDPDAMELD